MSKTTSAIFASVATATLAAATLAVSAEPSWAQMSSKKGDGGSKAGPSSPPGDTSTKKKDMTKGDGGDGKASPPPVAPKVIQK